MKEDNANIVENNAEDVVMCICGRSRDGLCHCSEFMQKEVHYNYYEDNYEEYSDLENDDN
ncbi:MAG: hypothetical protein E7080_00910 [Bacteroidales bacterium]|nr:hypothetical protein [Bacteroidales bacterium]